MTTALLINEELRRQQLRTSLLGKVHDLFRIRLRYEALAQFGLRHGVVLSRIGTEPRAASASMSGAVMPPAPARSSPLAASSRNPQAARKRVRPHKAGPSGHPARARRRASRPSKGVFFDQRVVSFRESFPACAWPPDSLCLRRLSRRLNHERLELPDAHANPLAKYSGGRGHRCDATASQRARLSRKPEPRLSLVHRGC
jgi:hypothetical protein